MSSKWFVSFDSHRAADGSVDWSSYRAAQVANGESCYRCGAVARTFGTGKQELCSGCREFDSDKKEVRHDSRVRCPSCKHSWDVYDGESYELLSDGEHDVACNECGVEFTVSTHISYSFTSMEKDD